MSWFWSKKISPEIPIRFAPWKTARAAFDAAAATKGIFRSSKDNKYFREYTATPTPQGLYITGEHGPGVTLPWDVVGEFETYLIGGDVK